MTERDKASDILSTYEGYRESNYRKRWSSGNRGNVVMARELDEALYEILASSGLLPLSTRRVLDIGCGYGNQLASLQRWGAIPSNLYGIDLIPERISAATRRHPELTFKCANSEHLDFPDGWFDLAMLFTVLSSIPDERMQMNVVGEAIRVLKPGGVLVIYDMRFPSHRNRKVRPVTIGLLHRLAPGASFTSRTLTVIAPLARRLPNVEGLYPALTRLSLLHSHRLTAVRPMAVTGRASP